MSLTSTIDHRSRLRATVAGIVIVGALLILALWAMAVASVHNSREAALAHAGAETHNLAAAFADEVSHVLDGVDDAMNVIARHLRAGGDPREISHWAKQIPLLSLATIQVGVIGPDGKLVSTTLEPDPKPIDLSDREHVRVHREGVYEGIFISKPVVGRVSGKTTLNITKGVRDEGGNLIAIVLFSLSPGQLTGLSQALDLGQHGALALVGFDNVVRARFTRDAPDGLAGAGETLPGHHIPAALSNGATEGYLDSKSPVDGIDRIGNFRNISKYPLRVIASVSREDVLVGAGADARMISGIAGVATLLLVGFAGYLVRETRRRAAQAAEIAIQGEKLERANNRLEEDIARREQVEQELRETRETLQDAVESISEAFVIYDRNDRFVMCNERYRKIYHRNSAEMFEPGARFEDLVREGAYLGFIADAIGREEEWVAERLAAHRNVNDAVEQRLADGRCLLISERRMRNGGTAGLRVDITRLKESESRLRETNLEMQAEVTRRRDAELWAKEAQETLQDAIDSLSEGFAIYDRDDHLVMCNATMRGLHPQHQDVMRPGLRFDEIMRKVAYSGHPADAAGREEEWIAERLEAHHNPEGSFEQRLADGRHLLVTDRRMRNGGIASLRIDITALKQTEAQLREAMENLDRAQRTAGIGSIEVDLTSEPEQITWTPSACRLFGVDPVLTEPSTQFLLDLIHSDDREKVLEAANSANATGTAAPPLEYRIIRPDGAVRVVYRENTIQTDAAGKPIRRIITYKDITDLKDNEARLRETMEILERAQRLAHMGSLVRYLESDGAHCSDEMYRIFGVDRETFIFSTENFINAVLPEDRTKVAEAADQVASGINPAPFEYRIRRPDGTVRQIYRETEILLDEVGEPSAFVATIHDVTEARAAEAKLRQTKENLERAQRLAHMGSDIRDLATDHAEWSEESYRIFGVDPATFVPTTENFLAMVLPEDRAIVLATREQIAAGICPLPFEYRIRRPDGEIRHIYRETDVILNAVGKPIQMVGTIHDVTEERAAEAKLRQTKENLERAQRIAHMGSVVRDLATDEIECSDEVYRIFGIDPATSDPATSSFDQLLVPEDQGKLLAVRNQIAEGICPEPFEYRVQRPDGSVRYVYRETEIIRDASGKPVKFIGTLHDVTEMRAAEQRQRELQKQLQHSQKLEALGTLAGGVAHELNNALMPICALSKMMLKTLPPESEDREDLGMIATASDRARDLVQQILSFSRKQDSIILDASRKQVDLVDLLRQSLRMLRLTVPATVRFNEEISPVPLILADADQLYQIVINLVTNAAQAIGSAMGTVTVGAAPEPQPQAGSPDGQGGWIRLWIADTGNGMDARTVERIFEPFFTTKNVGEGTGLGLSVVHGIISDHGGRIQVESAPGKGTKFTIYLPVSAAAAVPMLAA